ncbi:hypothetical protein BDF19DRAFT_436413 [Syncephalis fuscata]|nr:hypothetical protein BDF19DRAFT_436413 [Syncephalis fuscata]
MTIDITTTAPVLAVTTLPGTDSFIQGQLGVTPVSLHGEIKVDWPETEESTIPAVIPVSLTVKLAGKEWTTADNSLLDDRGDAGLVADAQNSDKIQYRPAEDARFHLHSTLLRKAENAVEDINNSDEAYDSDDDAQNDKDEQAVSIEDLSESIRAAIARGNLRVPFEIALPDHLPSTLNLPHGSVSYKLSVAFAFSKRVNGPVQRMKWHFILPLYRYTKLPSSSAISQRHTDALEIPSDDTDSTNVYNGINLNPFTLDCSIDEQIAVEASLTYPCLIPSTTVPVQLRLRTIDAQADANAILAQYESRLKNIQLILHRVDSYRALDKSSSDRIYSQEPDKDEVSDAEDDKEDEERAAAANTISLGVEILSTEHSIHFSNLTKVSGQICEFECPASLLPTVKTRLLEVTYMYLVRLQLDDRAVEFFFPLDAVLAPSALAATNESSKTQPKLLSQIGQLFGLQKQTKTTTKHTESSQ